MSEPPWSEHLADDESVRAEYRERREREQDYGGMAAVVIGLVSFVAFLCGLAIGLRFYDD